MEEEEEGGKSKMKGFAENMSENFESLDTQKKSLRKSIYSVFFEWKGFEEQIGSTQNCFRQGLSQLESKEKELRSVQDSLNQSIKELDSERDSIKKKLQQVEDKEKEFKLFSDLGIAKLKKERDDFSKEIEFREANFQEREKTLEDLLNKLQIQRGEIEGREAKIIKLNKESADFLKDIETSKVEISEGLKEIERKRVEIEGKEANMDDFFKEIEFRKGKLEIQKDEIEEIMKGMERRKEEIEGKEEDVMKREKKVEANEKEMELMIERQREVDLKVKDVDLMIEDIVFKEKDVELSRSLNEKRSKELDKREKQLSAKVKDVELINEKRSKELDKREKQLGAKVKDAELINEKRSKELDKREKQLAAKVKDVELIRDMNEGRSNELDMREKQLGEKVNDVELMNEGRSNELEMWEKQLGTKESQLQMLIQKLEEHLDIVLDDKDGGIVMKTINQETEPKEKELQLMNIETNEKHSKEPPLQKCKELDVSKETFDDRSKVAESNHKHPNEVENLDSSHLKQKEFHLEKNLQRQLVTMQESHLEKEVSVKEKTPSLVGKGIREEGYDLYKFLQDRGQELHTVFDRDLKIIQQSKEPAKLVLTALEEFYNRVITEKETEEKKDTAFRCCILLMEQLMKLSVDTHLSTVKDEALKFARLWRTNMKIRDSFEVLGFLYLLASYKLTNAFPKDAVISFLEVVAVRRKTRDLCRRLDLKNSIHDLIRELIGKNRILLAFDYVHDLELVDVFPPVALLKRHVLSSSMEARKIGNNKGNRNPEAKDRALSFEISALKDVMKCIMRRSLQADYPPEEVKERIENLERQRESLKASSPENQKVDSNGSANTQHGNTNCPSKKEQRKRRRLDRGGGYNTSELPPPSKCPRHVPPPEVNHSEGHQSGEPVSRHPDPYSPRSQQQQHQHQHHNQSPRHVPPPEVNHAEGQRSGKPPSRHPDDITFHTVPYSPRQQQQHYNQSPRHVPPPEEHRSGNPSSRHPNNTTFHPDPYSPWQQQQQQQQHHLNQSDPLCHVNDLVSKYLTAGKRESVYPAHQFSYVEQPPLQSVTVAPGQPIYPAHPNYIR